MNDTEAIKTLRTCKTIVERLNNQGINIPLNSQEQSALNSFAGMLLVYKNFQDLRFLADRAGLRLHELGVLRVRATMENERRQGLARCIRCGCDKYEGRHHYLCHTNTGSLTFPNISDAEMQAIINRVVEAETDHKLTNLKRLEPLAAAG